jgi:hypothetical protein
MTDGSVMPLRRIAVVGFRARSVDNKEFIACRAALSLMPVPLGRPRRRGVSLMVVCPSDRAAG